MQRLRGVHAGAPAACSLDDRLDACLNGCIAMQAGSYLLEQGTSLRKRGIARNCALVSHWVHGKASGVLSLRLALVHVQVVHAVTLLCAAMHA